MNTLLQNEDIKRNILSFGYTGHRETMKKICRDIQFRHRDAILSNVPKNYPYSKSDLELLSCMTMRGTLTRFFQLRLCKCCSRHSHNKPDIQIRTSPKGTKYLYIVELKDWVPECKNLHNCVCSCRSESRYLCRIISMRSRANRHLWQ